MVGRPKKHLAGVAAAAAARRSAQSSAVGTASTTPQPPSYLEKLSYFERHKAFKNPAYQRTQARRNKSARQIVAQEREAMGRLAEERAAASGQPVNAVDLGITTYWSVEAPPSVLPRPKFCDITGLAAPYTDPKTRLRYASAEVYEMIKHLPAGSDQQYLALRGANVVLK